MPKEIARYAPNRTTPSRKSYAITVTDDTMVSDDQKRSLGRGDTVVIDPAVKPRHGDIVHAFDRAARKAILRLYYPLAASHPRGPGYVLRASNLEFSELYVSGGEGVTILGVATEKAIDLR